MRPIYLIKKQWLLNNPLLYCHPVGVLLICCYNAKSFLQNDKEE